MHSSSAKNFHWNESENTKKNKKKEFDTSVKVAERNIPLYSSEKDKLCPLGRKIYY